MSHIQQILWNRLRWASKIPYQSSFPSAQTIFEFVWPWFHLKYISSLWTSVPICQALWLAMFNAFATNLWCACRNYVNIAITWHWEHMTFQNPHSSFGKALKQSNDPYTAAWDFKKFLFTPLPSVRLNVSSSIPSSVMVFVWLIHFGPLPIATSTRRRSLYYLAHVSLFK